MKTTLLAAVLAVASITGAQALTIEDVRTAERSGITVLTQADMDRFHDCGIPQFGTGAGTIPWNDQMQLFGEAKMAGVAPQIIWLRHYDAAIAKCLAEQGSH